MGLSRARSPSLEQQGSGGPQVRDVSQPPDTANPDDQAGCLTVPAIKMVVSRRMGLLCLLPCAVQVKPLLMYKTNTESEDGEKRQASQGPEEPGNPILALLGLLFVHVCAPELELKSSNPAVPTGVGRCLTGGPGAGSLSGLLQIGRPIPPGGGGVQFYIPVDSVC